MKNGKKILVLFIELLAVAGIMVAFYSIQNKQMELVNVYQYSRDVQAATVINEGDIKSVQIPRTALTDTMVLDKNEIIGKAVENNVYAKDFVTKSVLIEEKEINPFINMDLSEYRQIAIDVNRRSAIGGNLSSGDTVDLAYVATAQATDGEENYNFTYSKTFMEDVLVYKVLTSTGDEYVNQTLAPVFNADGSKVMSTPAIVILAVTADQAEEIMARQSTGEINLIGRFEDSENAETSGYVIGDYGKIYTYYANPEE